MTERKVTEQILRGTREAKKSYEFDETHNPDLPAQLWFQESPEGMVLFIVFYTQACRWSRCLGCNLPSKSSSSHVGYRHLIAQVDHVFSLPEIERKREAIRKVIVSNNGSVLDEQTFSSTALIYLMAKLNLCLPNLAVLTLETRPEYVDTPELEFLCRALQEGDTPTELELAIGLESFDDHIRNEVFNKGLHLDAFERFVQHVAPYDYLLRCYLMQKPVPGMTDEQAIQDVWNAVDYLHGLASTYDVRVNIHLNPTYAARGTVLAESFEAGAFVPPYLVDVARAAAHSAGKRPSVFIGLYDEGLAVPGGSFIREGDEGVVARLEEFNRTQSHDILQSIVAENA